MNTPDAISKKRQELSTKLQGLEQKLKTPGTNPEQSGFLRAEIKALRRALRTHKRGTPAQRRAGW